MKTLPTQRWAVKPCACACAVLLASALPSFAQTNPVERTVRQIKFSTAPLELPPALQAKQQCSMARPGTSQGVSFIPVTFGTVVMAILAWEPAEDPVRSGSNQAGLKATEPRAGAAAAQKDVARARGAGQPAQEPSVGRLRLVRPRPGLSFGSDESPHTPITEKPPGWVLLKIRF